MTGPRMLDRPFLRSHLPSEPDLDLPAVRQPGESANISEAAEIAASRRLLGCPQYDECLSLAVDLRWQGWDCAGCDRHRR